jgi:AcrR family transcriptional regulator
MIQVVSERGVRAATIERVVSAAGVSRNTFYELFADRDACMLAAFEHAAALAAAPARAAWAAQGHWIDRVRAGLWALLEFFEASPPLANVCVVQSLAGSPATLARRRQICEELAGALEEGRVLARRQPPPLTAEGVVGGALAVIHARLLEHPPPALTEMFRPLMSFVVTPYLGPGAARAELSRPAPARSAPLPHETNVDPLAAAPVRLTHRTVRVLSVIAANPGLRNSEVSDRSGMLDEGQASRLLGRLARAGLIENTAKGTRRNSAKAWRLTPAGERLERSLGQELRPLEG